MSEYELSKQEREALEAEVQRELEKEQKAEAKKRIKEQMLREARQRIGLDEAVEEITIDLPIGAASLRIDNVIYQHGTTYNVRASVAASMREMIQRAWEHQAEIDGHKKDYYRKMRETHVSASGAARNAPMTHGGPLRG